MTKKEWQIKNNFKDDSMLALTDALSLFGATLVRLDPPPLYGQDIDKTTQSVSKAVYNK